VSHFGLRRKQAKCTRSKKTGVRFKASQILRSSEWDGVAPETLLYTVALGTVRSTAAVEMGRLSVTRRGSLFDAVFHGTVWSNEVRTLHLSDCIRETHRFAACWFVSHSHAKAESTVLFEVHLTGLIERAVALHRTKPEKAGAIRPCSTLACVIQPFPPESWAIWSQLLLVQGLLTNRRPLNRSGRM